MGCIGSGPKRIGSNCDISESCQPYLLLLNMHNSWPIQMISQSLQHTDSKRSHYNHTYTASKSNNLKLSSNTLFMLKFFSFTKWGKCRESTCNIQGYNKTNTRVYFHCMVTYCIHYKHCKTTNNTKHSTLHLQQHSTCACQNNTATFHTPTLLSYKAYNTSTKESNW